MFFQKSKVLYSFSHFVRFRVAGVAMWFFGLPPFSKDFWMSGEYLAKMSLVLEFENKPYFCIRIYTHNAVILKKVF